MNDLEWVKRIALLLYLDGAIGIAVILLWAMLKPTDQERTLNSEEGWTFAALLVGVGWPIALPIIVIAFLVGGTRTRKFSQVPTVETTDELKERLGRLQ